MLRARCIVGPKGRPCNHTHDHGHSHSHSHSHSHGHNHQSAKNELVCTGVVTFSQRKVGGPCLIQYDIAGLSKGQHGFHIHEKADFSQGCKSAGGHWNPHGKNHGAPSTDPENDCHAGDLGNIVADEHGRAVGSIESNLLDLSGKFSIIGRSVMVHADRDDLGKGDNSEPGVNGKTSLTTGNAGARVACGEIVEVRGDSTETKIQTVVDTGNTKHYLRLVMLLPVIGGSTAAWVIYFCYQLGKYQLPPQLLPCPPISLFTYQQPQQPIYAAIMCFAALVFITMTLTLHSALKPFVADDRESQSTLRANLKWGTVAFIGQCNK